LRADIQDQGRGRLGREWVSPLGNLYASTIVRLQPTGPPAATLAFVAAVATYEALTISAPGTDLQIKWPNDLLSLAGEKLCGMLLERKDDAVVIGIGVNLAHAPEGTGRAVTSITQLGEIPMLPQPFVELLAKIFADQLVIWRTYGAEAIFKAWKDRAHPIGTSITAQMPGGETLTGSYEGLTLEGALMLRLANGTIRAIHAADVFLV
jgi:BirA family transcriptional regulator, biotin operon repressor / biotin---[acetyl-CoA-carboxylase] ligase